MSGELGQILRAAAADYAVSQQKLYQTMSFEEYVELARERPEITRSAFARLYDAVLSQGMTEVESRKPGRRQLVNYHAFEDRLGGGENAIFGLTEPLMELVDALKAAKDRYGVERRILLLKGPVSGAKSSIVDLLKKMLEHYSRTDEGAWYSFKWKKDACYGANLSKVVADDDDYILCPLHEEPLRLIPERQRLGLLARLGIADKVIIRGDPCPFCRFVFKRLLESKYNGDFFQLLAENVLVCRLAHSEKDRIGIGTFQPKDEKNQDATELTGDVNYRKAAAIGEDSDPRAFNFDGEFEVANRGIIEFIEVLKLDVAFLYDLLGATQEHRIKPKKFSQVDIDEVIIGHTNEPEYQKLQNNEFMEALRDRTVKIDIPYVTKLDDEIKIYERDYNPRLVTGVHLAPHTLEMAAMWAVLTRLTDPKKANLTLLQKLKLYNGKTLPGFTEDNVRELKEEAGRNEGRSGISPRYIQDKIATAIIRYRETGCLNPFMVLNELEEGLEGHALITTQEGRRRCRDLLAVVKEEFEEIVKDEVQRAIAADEEQLKKLASNYTDNVRAYTQKEKVKNKFTGKDEEPDERLMRSVEEKVDIPESRKDDFRRELMNYIGALALDGKIFDYSKNERLAKALKLKLFEDQKDSIKLSSLVSKAMDEETVKKVEVIKDRMMKMFACCPICAKDYLDFVASIFARGEVKKDKK